MLFAKPVDLSRLGIQGVFKGLVTNGPKNGGEATTFSCRGRIGRGGRIVFDRWDALGGCPLRGGGPMGHIPRNNLFGTHFDLGQKKEDVVGNGGGHKSIVKTEQALENLGGASVGKIEV